MIIVSFYHNKVSRRLLKTIYLLTINTKKCITFTVPIEKEFTRIDKNGEEIIKHISYILQFTDSARFTVSSFSNLVNNLSEGIHRIKCKFRQNDKKMWNMWNWI